MDELNITEVLVTWGISHDIINNFLANGIGVEHLPKLTTELLKELCPHLATRLILQDKISEIISAQAPTETNSSNPCTSNNTVFINLDDLEVSNLLESPKTVQKSFPQFDLETLLQISPGGNSIVQYYKTYGCLNNNKRSQLTDIIIKHLYTYIVNCRITYEDYNLLAAKIITLFPKESVGIYFTKPIKKNQSINGRSTVARGKLVDKVRNLLYKYGDRKRRSTSIDNDIENTPPLKKTNIEDLQEFHSRDILWLNSNSEPWDEVMNKWKATFNLRKESDQKNIHEYLQDWKILSDPRGDVLINIDFDLLYPEKGLNFYLNWETFIEKLIELKSTQDEGILNLINSLKNIDDELKIPTQLKILAKLVPPKGRLSKKVKFTTQEAIDSLFICVPNAGDVDETIRQQKEKALAKKLSIQPYIILQGSLNKIKFELESDDHDRKDCISVDWCELNGIRYNANNVLLLDVNDDIPKYCIINKIVLNQCNNDILFDCFCLDIITYSAHLRAYKVVQTTRRRTISYVDLYTNLISILYKVKLESYVKVDLRNSFYL